MVIFNYFHLPISYCYSISCTINNKSYAREKLCGFLRIFDYNCESFPYINALGNGNASMQMKHKPHKFYIWMESSKLNNFSLTQLLSFTVAI